MTPTNFGLGVQLLYLLYHSAKVIAVTTNCSLIKALHRDDTIPAKKISLKVLFRIRLLSRLVSRIANPTLYATE